MNEQLQPCPFCGSLSLYWDGKYALHCNRCGAQGPDADVPTLAAADAIWNQRADTDKKEM